MYILGLLVACAGGFFFLFPLGPLFSDDFYMGEDAANSMTGMLVFGLILLAIGIALIISARRRVQEQESEKAAAAMKIKRFDEKIEMFYYQELEKLGVKNSFEDYCYSVDIGEHSCGISNVAFFQIETIDQYCQRFKITFEDEQKLALADVEKSKPIKLEYIKIPIDKIQYFAKEGDIQYTTQISGGGGGGSSLLGAVVGGVVAGEVGAIIGSRKETTPITSSTQTHDTRTTIIKYYKGNTLKSLSYKGTEVYDLLLKNIPEKDLLSVQLSSQKAPKNEGAKEKLIELKTLFEEGLIDEAEYNEKRQEILKQI